MLSEVRRLNGVVGQPAPELAFHEIGTGAPRQLSGAAGKGGAGQPLGHLVPSLPQGDA